MEITSIIQQLEPETAHRLHLVVLFDTTCAIEVELAQRDLRTYIAAVSRVLIVLHQVLVLMPPRNVLNSSQASSASDAKQPWLWILRNSIEATSRLS